MNIILFGQKKILSLTRTLQRERIVQCERANQPGSKIARGQKKQTPACAGNGERFTARALVMWSPLKYIYNVHKFVSQTYGKQEKNHT